MAPAGSTRSNWTATARWGSRPVETVQLRSRNDKDFTRRYPGVVAALADLPDQTVIDGEMVALDAAGKPVFSLLQNGGTNVHFYVFDVLLLAGQDATGEPLVKRRELLENRILPSLSEPVRCSPVLEVSLADLIQSIGAQGLEGLVAKRANSKYQPGLRSGAWMKMRVNLAEEFVIGGYSVGGSVFDALILGLWRGGWCTSRGHEADLRPHRAPRYCGK